MIFFRSITNGYLGIKAGESQIVVAGGQESMSQAPHVMYLRNGVKMGDYPIVDTMIHDGLTDAFEGVHMGVTGKIVFIFTLFDDLVLYKFFFIS